MASIDFGIMSDVDFDCVEFEFKFSEPAFVVFVSICAGGSLGLASGFCVCGVVSWVGNPPAEITLVFKNKNKVKIINSRDFFMVRDPLPCVDNRLLLLFDRGR